MPSTLNDPSTLFGPGPVPFIGPPGIMWQLLPQFGATTTVRTTAVAIDPSTPPIAVQTSGTVATVTNASSFTPPANSTLLILYSANTVDPTSPAVPGITDSLGVHLTYTLLDHSVRSDTPLADGQAAAWVAPITTSAPMTITITNNAASGGRHAAMAVIVLTGVHASMFGAHGEGGQIASGDTVAVPYTPQYDGSLTFLAVADWSATGLMTPGGGTYVIGTGAVGAPDYDYGFLRKELADNSKSVPNSINAKLGGASTSVRYVYVEIAPAELAPAISNVTGASVLSGDSTLTASAIVNFITPVATLTGDSTLTASGTVTKLGASVLSGDSTLTASATVTKLGVSALSGQSTLAVTGLVNFVTPVSALSGQSTLTASGLVNFVTPVATLTGQSTLTSAGLLTRFGASTLSGQSTLTASAFLTTFATTSLSGQSTLTATGTLPGAAAILSGQSTLTVTGLVNFITPVASLSGQSTLIAAATVTKLGASVLSGDSTLTASGLLTRLGTAALSGQSTLGATAFLTQFAIATLTGQSTLLATGTLPGAAAILSGQSTLTVSAVVTKFGVAPLTSQVTMTAAGVATIKGIAPLTANSVMVATATLLKTGGAVLSGQSTLSAAADVNTTWFATAVLSGQGVMVAIGTLQLPWTLAYFDIQSGNAASVESKATNAVGSESVTQSSTVESSGSVTYVEG